MTSSKNTPPQGSPSGDTSEETKVSLEDCEAYDGEATQPLSPLVAGYQYVDGDEVIAEHKNFVADDDASLGLSLLSRGDIIEKRTLRDRVADHAEARALAAEQARREKRERDLAEERARLAAEALAARQASEKEAGSSPKKLLAGTIMALLVLGSALAVGMNLGKTHSPALPAKPIPTASSHTPSSSTPSAPAETVAPVLPPPAFVPEITETDIPAPTYDAPAPLPPEEPAPSPTPLEPTETAESSPTPTSSEPEPSTVPVPSDAQEDPGPLRITLPPADTMPTNAPLSGSEQDQAPFTSQPDPTQ